MQHRNIGALDSIPPLLTCKGFIVCFSCWGDEVEIPGTERISQILCAESSWARIPAIKVPRRQALTHYLVMRKNQLFVQSAPFVHQAPFFQSSHQQTSHVFDVSAAN